MFSLNIILTLNMSFLGKLMVLMKKILKFLKNPPFLMTKTLMEAKILLDKFNMLKKVRNFI